MRQLHRLEGAVRDHGRPEPGAETEKKHPSSLIASERLHGGVIDEFDGVPERLGEIKPHPASAEIVRFAQRMVVNHGSRVAYRDDVVIPVLGDSLYIPDHPAGGHGWAGGNLALLGLSGGQQLDVSAANIDHQNSASFPGGVFHDSFSTCPPNSYRMAESSLSAKVSSPLDANR